MAIITEQTITIKVSKLVKDDAATQLDVINDAIKTDLISVIEQLINDTSCIVETD